MSHQADKLLKFLTKRREPVTAIAIQEQLKLSETVVTELLRAARHAQQVVKIGSTRNARYIATQDTYGCGTQIPLYAIDTQGATLAIAHLIPVINGGSVVQPLGTASNAWLLGETGLGHYADLPYFIDDLRPQGFLGRHEARRLAQQHGYPADPRYWQTQHITQYLLQENSDLPGNLVLGEAAMQRWRTTPAPVPLSPAQFPAQAAAVLAGEPASSSAGGEQPKFAAYTEHGHAIIKFSAATESPVARRWADLLIAEHIALDVLPQLGIPTPNTQVYSVAGQVFLVSPRFDRIGLYGRSPVISLAAIDAEFVGVGSDWYQIGIALHQQGLIDADCLTQITQAQCFGHWIANTDMHLGNLSLIPTARGFELAPLYDMTPMYYAPMQDKLLADAWQPPTSALLQSNIGQATKALADEFWVRLSETANISEDFRQIALRRVKTWHK